jgi:hypothetical protein
MKNIYSYDDILASYYYFDKINHFTYFSDYEKYLKDTDDETNVYAEFRAKNIKFIDSKNTIIINNKKFNISALPGIGRYEKDKINWHLTYIFKKNKSICVETTFIGSRYPQIIIIKNFLNPKPYYFNGLFLYCTYLRKIKNKFYFPTYKIFGSKYKKNAEMVKFNYRQILTGFSIKYKYESKFQDASNDFELTKSELIK